MSRAPAGLASQGREGMLSPRPQLRAGGLHPCPSPHALSFEGETNAEDTGAARAFPRRKKKNNNNNNSNKEKKIIIKQRGNSK